MKSRTKEEVIQQFNPNGVGALGSLFGLPFSPEHASIVVIPVPWEVTVSYGAGTAQGPEAVLQASPQLDLYQPDIADAWQMGISMLPIPEQLLERSTSLREKSELYIEALENQNVAEQPTEVQQVPTLVNAASGEMCDWVQAQAEQLLEAGKIPAVLGGDHSTPLGLMRALAAYHKDGFGILQLDAHADLRIAYEGFSYSHASIMYNALQIEGVNKLVQVGIRDICGEEVEVARKNSTRVSIFYDRYLKQEAYKGKSWHNLVSEIIEQLPDKVYISFDIDGLDPKLCPGTGTPVPGGFEYEEAMYLIEAVVRSGRTIVGFDLCEVAPGESEWNGNVGARVLYRMANLAGVSQGLLKLE
ncbi:agmatinase family protein [Cesiribacter sp. SM1]|uniref:agmatinase family protein n=1 Tax=Cesiribacter sp. SM1 TaxID=2861196 RepID=UPI001CD7E663|nr:agmatinase family protein [Cesiribacter sp. SM1]